MAKRGRGAPLKTEKRDTKKEQKTTKNKKKKKRKERGSATRNGTRKGGGGGTPVWGGVAIFCSKKKKKNQKKNLGSGLGKDQGQNGHPKTTTVLVNGKKGGTGGNIFREKQKRGGDGGHFGENTLGFHQQP